MPASGTLGTRTASHQAYNYLSNTMMLLGIRNCSSSTAYTYCRSTFKLSFRNDEASAICGHSQGTPIHRSRYPAKTEGKQKMPSGQILWIVAFSSFEGRPMHPCVSIKQCCLTFSTTTSPLAPAKIEHVWTSSCLISYQTMQRYANCFFRYVYSDRRT